jgi:hypothetical protein
MNEWKCSLRNGITRLLNGFVEAAGFVANVTKQGGAKSSGSGGDSLGGGLTKKKDREMSPLPEPVGPLVRAKPYDWKKQNDFPNE